MMVAGALWLPLEQLDPDPDAHVQQKATDFQDAINLERSLEMLCRIDSGADVVTYRLPGYDQVPGQLGDDPGAVDPDVDEEAPEGVVESCRISSQKI